MFLMLLIVLKLMVTLFTVFIYAKFSPFPDAERYLSATLKSWDLSLLFNRTLFTDFFYASLKHLLGSNTLVHLFISAMLGWVLWYVLKSEYHYINKKLLIACLCLPHFLIWTGMVGKEALAITGFLLIIKVCVDLTVWNKLRLFPLMIGLFISLIERPHYALGYIYLFIISLITAQNKIKLMGLFSPKQSLLIFLVGCAYLLLFLYHMDFIYTDALLQFMLRIQTYFLNITEAVTNRWDIIWQSPSDFFNNLSWGLPTSIIGPTWFEALARPAMLPVFLEGCYSLLLLIVMCCLLIRIAQQHVEYSSILIWGFIPALIYGLLINYPFGLFNAGSAIRYKQSLTPLFYFYPLLFIGAIQKKYHQNSIYSRNEEHK